jgi:hypothetical protein
LELGGDIVGILGLSMGYEQWFQWSMTVATSFLPDRAERVVADGQEGDDRKEALHEVRPVQLGNPRAGSVQGVDGGDDLLPRAHSIPADDLAAYRRVEAAGPSLTTQLRFSSARSGVTISAAYQMMDLNGCRAAPSITGRAHFSRSRICCT